LVPNKKNIEEAVEWLARNRKRNETILLALSGHGITLEVKDANKRFPFFCPSDSSLDSMIKVDVETGQHESMVNINWLMERLGQSGADDKLIIVDACRNVQQAKRRNVDSSDIKAVSGVAVIYGCKNEQFSYEFKKERNGYLTHWLLKAFKGEAAQKGEVNIYNLMSYLSDSMRKNSKTDLNGEEQEPKFLAGDTGGITLAVNVPKDRNAERPAKKSITNSIDIKLMRIPKGKFLMGSPEEEEGRGKSETQHEVTISQDFYMGATEVTQSQWRKLMGNNPSKFKGDDLPVETVSWEEAVEFCKRLSKMPEEKSAGRTYRLPTEAEWEYACRAGTTTPFHFGSQLNGKLANCNGTKPHGTETEGPYLEKTTPVEKYSANAWGLYDMHGNVLEWCADWAAFYPTGPVIDPTGPANGSDRVNRGGCWISAAVSCRSAFRLRLVPSFRLYGLGFRVALSSSGIPK
jgi:sulfatase modifying factor 1